MHYFLYLIFPEGAALKLLELVVALELLQVRNIHITHAVHIAHVVHITHAVHIAHVVHVTHVVHPRLKIQMCITILRIHNKIITERRTVSYFKRRTSKRSDQTIDKKGDILFLLLFVQMYILYTSLKVVEALVGGARDEDEG